MHVYILSEITKRELDPNLLVSIIAAANGNSVLIANMDTIEFLSKKNLLSKGIFHTKSLVHDDRKQDLHYNLFNKGIKITSIDEENGLVKENLETFSNTRFSENSLKYAEKIFCWGNHDYSTLINTYKNFKQKFHKTGTPRTDLWRLKFKDYWKNENTSNFNKINQILISLNFGLINGFETLEKKIQKLHKAKYFQRFPKFEDEINLIANQNKKDLIYFKELINYLSKELKNINFLVRPHPRENKVTWEKILDKRENVTINNDDNFNKALSSSDLLIQNGCTTAFQAAMYKVPVISYVVDQNEMSHGKPANKIGKKISTKEEVKILIEKHISGEKIVNSHIDEVLNNKIFINKDKLSSYLINEEWIKIGKKIPYKSNNWRLIKFKLLLHDFSNLLKRDNKFEKINIKKINSKKELLKKILNIKEKIYAKKISNKSFLIKKY